MKFNDYDMSYEDALTYAEAAAAEDLPEPSFEWDVENFAAARSEAVNA